MPNENRTKSALLIVDVQKDFCAGGALAVPESERVLVALNRHLARAAAEGMPVYASRDWHPDVTNHFAPFGGRWPVHCVRETVGARSTRPWLPPRPSSSAGVD
jgi:nicotinamidase/pyrazinamidase